MRQDQEHHDRRQDDRPGKEESAAPTTDGAPPQEPEPEPHPGGRPDHDRAGAEAARKIDSAFRRVIEQPPVALVIELIVFVAALTAPWNFEKTSFPDALFQFPGFTILATGAAGVGIVVGLAYLVRSVAARTQRGEFANQAAGVVAEEKAEKTEKDLADAKAKYGDVEGTLGETLEELEELEKAEQSQVERRDQTGHTSEEPGERGEPPG